MRIKVDIEVPDTIIEGIEMRNLRIFAGVDVIALKSYGEKNWKIKTKGCIQCGKCCSDLTKGFPFPVIDGKCIYLTEDNKCGLAIYRPYACAISEPSDYCHVEYKKQSNENNML